jgi:hypothetical protein
MDISNLTEIESRRWQQLRLHDGNSRTLLHSRHGSPRSLPTHQDGNSCAPPAQQTRQARATRLRSTTATAVLDGDNSARAGREARLIWRESTAPADLGISIRYPLESVFFRGMQQAGGHSFHLLLERTLAGASNSHEGETGTSLVTHRRTE